MGCVVRRNADLDTVPNHHFDTIFLHSSGKHTPHADFVITLNVHSAAT